LQTNLENTMIIVPIKENETIDKALKKYKKKFEKTGTVKQLRARQAFEKPSVSRRTEIKKAVYRLQLQSQVQA
jgi:small subunit ribosomal protein S21